MSVPPPHISSPAPSVNDEAIPPSRSGLGPLSWEQRRLWFVSHLSGQTAAYTIPLGFRVRGPLDAEALRRAVTALVERHDALRTTFHDEGGEPVALVRDEPEADWQAHDVSALTPAERAERARELVAATLERPYHLPHGPMLRALLVRLNDDEHLFILQIHHLAADGPSASVVRRDLGTLYAREMRGTPAPTPPPARFGDFAAWQRAVLTEQVLEDDADFWRGELASAPRVLELPADFPRPRLQSFAGAKHSLTVDGTLAAALRLLARRERTPLFPVLLSAFGVLLARYARAGEVVVGVPVANRWAPGTDEMVGFFANTLPLRVRIDPRDTVRDLLRRAWRGSAQALSHARLPFDRMVEIAEVKRDAARPPLVQVLMTLSDTSEGTLSLAGTRVEIEPVDTASAVMDLALVVEDTGAEIRAELQYATALFEPATIHRLARHWTTLLAAFAADPLRPVADIAHADEDERRQVLAWSGVDAPFPRDLCLHQLFQAQARVTPDAAAVVHAAETVTYAELNRRANRLARRLRRAGVGPESRVGICMARTPAFVAAILGVLKAGGAYVPLDPAHPRARTEAVLRAAGARVVVADAESRGALPSIGGMAVILPDDAETRAESPADADGGARPDNLAYVIFTSGSTGGPKGVEVEHRSAVALAQWMRGALTPEERAGVMLGGAFTFDVTVGDVFGTLCWGGTLLLVENALAPPPAISSPRSAAMAPAAAAELLRRGALPPGIRTLLVGGEAMPAGLARELHAQPSISRIVNIYGPTETCVYATALEVPRDVRRITIGRPVGSARAYVLDAGLRPCGVGVPGELCIGGPGVARGYTARPALTAERFVPDPHGPPGARMFRSRDAVRWREDGTLEFLGRMDAQLKVRGFRIEAGEVEQALAAHPSVAAAAVDARSDGGDGKRLVAWLVAQPGEPLPAPGELRAFVRERLPEYMAPAAVEWVDALPRTSGGKLDRRALPDPGAPLAPAADYRAPGSAVEARLAALWAEVLGVERVGLDDDFFDLGGQSILATRLVSRIRAELGADVPVAALLRGPTVALLAREMAGAGGEVRLPLVPLHTGGSRVPLFLAPPGGGHVVCYHDLAGLLAPEHPVYGLQVRGIDDGLAPDRSVPDIAAYFLDGVRALRPRGPYALGGWSFGGLVAWEMARQLEAAGEEVSLLALLDTGVPATRENAAEALEPERVMVRIIADLAGWAAASMVRVERLRGLPPRHQALEAIRQVGSPRALPESRADQVLELTRARLANLNALVDYCDPPVYGGHLTYFRTAAADRGLPPDGALEFWSSRALGGATVLRVPGSHGTVLQKPYVEDLAARLVREMEKAATASIFA